MENMQEEIFSMDRAAESAVAEHKRILEDFERKREARGIHIPSNDVEVKSELRKRHVPVTLFGEDAYDRRERLRLILALELEKADKGEQVEEEYSEEEAREEHGETPSEYRHTEEKQTETFYTEGSVRLKVARKDICLYSLRCARDRIFQEKRRVRALKAFSESEENISEEDLAFARAWQEQRKEYIQSAQHLSVISSQFGDDRPLTGVCLSPSQDMIATGSWSGRIRLWNIPDCDELTVLDGHSERISSVQFSPILSETYLLASTSGDCTTRLWQIDSKAVSVKNTSVLRGHLARVTSAEFHPSGKYLATASFDQTWRLWDIETRKELLLQEGHSKPLYKISFQPDGSLAVSAGADSVARMWDLRTGRSIASFLGHVKSILTVDFSPDGYHFATGSEDHSIRIWDIRKRRCVYTIPAHTGLVSHVEFHRNGHFLLSSSFDKSCRIWSTQGWVLIKALIGHEDKVMGCQATHDGNYIVSTCFDKTWKLWGVEKPFETTNGGFSHSPTNNQMQLT